MPAGDSRGIMESNALKKLVDEARTGSKDAFEELVRITYPNLLKRALSLTGNIEDARDALQDAYIRAFKSVTNFRGDSSFFKWMITIVNNASATLMAKARRRSFELILGNPAEDETKESLADSPVLERDPIFVVELLKALEVLPENLKFVFVLKDLYGFDHDEIADTLGISESNSKIRLHRARKQLRAALGAAGFESQDDAALEN